MAALWLLEHLGTAPRLVREIEAAAHEAGISTTVLKRAARSLPILRRPRELRGPWVWRFPEEEEQVLARFHCPLGNCAQWREGWLPFGRSKPLFMAGILTYQVRGRLRLVRSAEDDGYLLRIAALRS